MQMPKSGAARRLRACLASQWTASAHNTQFGNIKKTTQTQGVGTHLSFPRSPQIIKTCDIETQCFYGLLTSHPGLTAACLTRSSFKEGSLKLEWVLTTANAAGNNALTCLLKHGGARDNNFLVNHPMTDQR
jgi:hypothetical protein